MNNKIIWKKLSEKRGKHKYLERYRRKKRNRKRNANKNFTNKTTKFHRIEQTFIAPNVFSLFDNSDQTIGYFSDIINYLDKINKINNGKKYQINIDMKETKTIEIGAVMYLLTIMKNTRIKNKMKNDILWYGRFPEDNNAKKVLIDTGFTQYVKTSNANINYNSDNIQITSGNLNDPNIAKQVCDLVINNYSIQKKNIGFLKEILNELMDNTVDHAYRDKCIFEPCWYLFAGCDNNKIIITFLDNGIGISKTVNKKINELLIKDLFGKSDSFYIESALNGEFRTRTKMKNRGKGLPEIYNNYKDKLISNLKILSNKGIFNNDTKIDINKRFEGTLFSFEIIKKGSDTID